jgi:hypothetical protein
VGGLGIDHWLAGARVGVRAKDHGGVAPQHADEVLEGWETLGRFGWRRSSRCSCRFGRRDWSFRRLPLGFPLFFFNDFLAQFAFGGKRAPVDYAKRFFLFMVFMFGQGAFLSDLYLLQFITGCQIASLQRAHPSNLHSNLDSLSKLRLRRKVGRLIQHENS